jgi:hypothetical protein
MSNELVILLLAYVVTALLLVFLVPRNKIREAMVIFLFKQMLTWLLGLTISQLKLIDYPVRSFPYATKSSFDFEYFFYPSICVFFNLYYPAGKSLLHKFLHYFFYCTLVTILELIFEKYTDLITYINWHWYITWISLFITFYLSFKFYFWFFRLDQKSIRSS